MQRPSVVFPQPDSPTSSIGSPALTSSVTSSTACTRSTSFWKKTPFLIGKYFRRCSTERSAPFPDSFMRAPRRPRLPGGKSTREGRRFPADSDHASTGRRLRPTEERAWRVSPRLDELRMDGRITAIALRLHRQEAGVAVAVARPLVEPGILGGAPAEDLRAPRREVTACRERDQRGRLALDRRQPP